MKPADIEDKLQNKFGFERNLHHTDHRWFVLKLQGIAPVTTFFSNSREEIRAVLEGKIARQLKVNSRYLRGMVDCTRSCEEYYQHIRNFR